MTRGARSIASFVVIAAAVAAAARPARAADDCVAAAKAELKRSNVTYAQAYFWDGKKATCLTVCTTTLKTGDRVIDFMTSQQAVTDAQLSLTSGLVRDPTAPGAFNKVSQPQQCTALFYRRFVFGTPPPPQGDGGKPNPHDLATASVTNAYLHPRQSADIFHATSASSMASEAAQILGQIVVDRASAQAYALLRDKMLEGLNCPEQDSKRTTHFSATCEVIYRLRLEDLAMAPNELRVALLEDAMTFINKLHVKPAAVAPVARAPIAGRAPTTNDPPPPLIADPIAFLNGGIERRIVPVLARPIDSITGHSAELEIRGIVDGALRDLEKRGEKAYCNLKDQDRVLAAASLAFAACVAQATASDCSVMQLVPTFDDECADPDPNGTPPQPGPKLTKAQISYAQSIAGHLMDAYNLQKDLSTPDVQGRLLAAADATFEVACMYAAEPDPGETSGWECKLDDKAKPGTALSDTELVAIARDLTISAIGRDGTGFIAVVIRAVVRALPGEDDNTAPKAIRTMAAVAAYAATYTSGASPDDAHKQRTALLESLTKDMTVRTDRGGDWIVGVGGSLRAVGGARIGHQSDGSRPDALAPIASLTLGFASDWLFQSRHGIHLEVGVLDLGQYLSWDDGGNLATPDLGAAVSPSVTLAYFWGREAPFFIGGTAGYSPTYQFTSDATKPKGSINVGLTFGVYIPLFDFN